MLKKTGVLAKKVPALIFGVLLVIMLVSIIPYARFSLPLRAGGASPARRISQVKTTIDGREQDIVLPYVVRGLAPRTEVKMQFQVDTKPDDYMQVKTAYAPLCVTVGGKKIYAYGNQATRPSFLQDPPTNLKMLPVGNFGERAEVELIYLSPKSMKELVITQPVISNQSGLIRWDMLHGGVMLSLGLFFILFGLILLLISGFVIRMEKKGSLFLWLGLFSIDTGIWNFGESDISIFYINDPNLLYMMRYVSFMTILLPIGMIIYRGLEFHNPWPLKATLYLCLTADALAIVLQLLGVMMFTQSSYIFRTIVPLVFLVYLCAIFWEIVRYRTTISVCYLLPFGCLVVFGTLELAAYRRIVIYTPSSFFQIGVLFFFILMCINAALQVRRAIRHRRRENEQEYEIQLLEYQISEQRKHQQVLLDKQNELRRQRHDLRHQLTVIRDYNLENRREELNSFIESLIADIPTNNETRYCENDAVNAVITYYASVCAESGLKPDIQIAVPGRVPGISDKALCIIFGNLLENAIEACNRMEPESKKFIRLKSVVHMDMLVVTMENSYNGQVRKWGNQFISSKREEIGIGLSSIESIVRAADGEARFDPDKNVFRSLVYLKKTSGEKKKKTSERKAPERTPALSVGGAELR